MSVCRGGYAVVLGLAAALVLSPAGQAGGCPPAAVSYSYSYAPAAVSYAPVSYAPVSYAAPVKVIKEKVYIPQAVKVYASPDFYSSSQDAYRDKLLVDAVAGKTAEALQLQQRLQGLEQQLQQSQQLLQQRQSADLEYQEYQRWKYERQQQYAPPPQQAPPQRMPPANGYNGHHAPQQAPQQQPPPGYGPPPQQQPQSRSAPGSVPEGLEQAVAQDCRSCHGGTKQEAGVDLRNLEDMPWELRVVCLNEVLAGTMPYGRDSLPAEKKALWQEFERVVRPTLGRGRASR